MTRRRDGDREDRAAFEKAMEGVVPLADRDKIVAPLPGEVRPRAAAPEPPPIEFELRLGGERSEGVAVGIDRKHLRRLRSSEFRAEVRLDLHGLDLATARATLRDSVNAAAAAGRLRLLVIHGKGLHSEASPVLKTALPGWLTEPPLDRWVMAFTTAAPRDGGAGATCVLLRRRAAGNAR